MKNYIFKLILLLLGFSIVGCNNEKEYSLFYGDQEQTIIAYMETYSSDYTSFLELMVKSGYSELFRVYGTYTMFAFSNDAWDAYLEKEGRSSMDDFTQDELLTLLKCCVISTSSLTSDSFVNGNLGDLNMLKEHLVTKFMGGSEITVNNYYILDRDIELLNGVLFRIDGVLEPISSSLYDIAQETEGMTIFNEAIEAVGLSSVLDSDYDASGFESNYTLFMCSDDVYAEAGITSYAALESAIRGDDTELITSTLSPMYQYVARHILKSEVYQNEFDTGLYQTYGTLYVDIVVGDEFIINPDSEIPSSLDLTQGNIQATNGVCHYITAMLDVTQVTPSTIYYDFADQPELVEWKATNAGNWGSDQEQYSLGYDYAAIETNCLQFYYYHSPGGSYDALDNEDGMLCKTGSWYCNYTIDSVPDGDYEVWLHVLKGNGTGAVIQCYWNDIKLGRYFGTRGDSSGRYVGGVEVDRWGSAGANYTFYNVSNWVVMGIYLGNVTVSGESVFGLKTVVDGLGLVDRIEFVPIVSDEE